MRLFPEIDRRFPPITSVECRILRAMILTELKKVVRWVILYIHGSCHQCATLDVWA